VDELARDYLLLALALGRLEEGIVDAYYGPPELRAEADARDVTAEQLAAEAVSLRQRTTLEPDTQRALWLDRQLLALETIGSRLAGEELDYVEEVRRCFDAAPTATPDEHYHEARATLDELLPPGADLQQRLEERNRRLTVPAERLHGIADWLMDEVRQSCLTHFALPPGESLTVSMVSGQPWSGYNWYEGQLRSRIEFNTDLPARAPELISLATHEGFPGHHLEHAWKETSLVRQQGRAEASIQLINTPEAYVSEGLAEVGGRYVVDRPRWQELLAAICQRSGSAPAKVQPEREWQISRTLNGLRAVSADAALLLHAEQRPRAEVLDFLQEKGLRNRQQAEKSLEFIGHPLWRTYVFCYSGGERLLARWCAAAGDLEAQRRRFFRLLTEQLTPSGLAAELADAEIS